MEEPASSQVIGAVCLSYFVMALPAGLLLKGFVRQDAAVTASAILANEQLYQLGVSLGLAGNAVYLALMALFYDLFRRVGPRVSLLAAFFGLAGCSVQLIAGLFQVAPLALLKDADLAALLQAPAAAALSLKLYSQAYSISLVLFGCFDIFIGWLIVRSRFLPRAIGVLMMAAGAGWLLFLWPPLARAMSAYIVGLGGLAEIILMLWLLAFGVSVARWREMTP